MVLFQAIVSITAEFMVTEKGFTVPVKLPAPAPVMLAIVYVVEEELVPSLPMVTITFVVALYHVKLGFFVKVPCPFKFTVS
jgi:hypothetical protein